MKTTTLQGVPHFALTPTAWSQFPHADEVRPLDENDHDVLAEIKEVLEKHNAIDRFGVNLIHRHFDLNDGEILFESTNEQDRVQVIDVRRLSEIEARGDVLETQWVFNGGKGLVCLKYCDYNMGHKHIHQYK